MSAKQTRETTDDNSPIGETIERLVTNIAVTTDPVVIVGVNRKVNIGNYENIDVYTGLALPLPGASVERMDQLRALVEEMVEEGIKIAAGETYKRYASIKELASGQTQ